jgi:hypothetical protein
MWKGSGWRSIKVRARLYNITKNLLVGRIQACPSHGRKDGPRVGRVHLVLFGCIPLSASLSSLSTKEHHNDNGSKSGESFLHFVPIMHRMVLG